MKHAIAWVFGALAIFAAFGAYAHALNLFVHEEGGAVKGSAYFTGGVPAKNVAVQIQDSKGGTFTEIRTDEQGNFTFTGSRPAGALRFVVSTPDGHRAESTLEGGASIPAANAGAPTGEAPTSSVEAASYERQLGAIQVALDRLEHRIWLRDVIGGIGYIFGVAGLWALWKSRSGRTRH